MPRSRLVSSTHAIAFLRTTLLTRRRFSGQVFRELSALVKHKAMMPSCRGSSVNPIEGVDDLHALQSDSLTRKLTSLRNANNIDRIALGHALEKRPCDGVWSGGQRCQLKRERRQRSCAQHLQYHCWLVKQKPNLYRGTRAGPSGT